MAEKVNELGKQLEEAASKMKACGICYTPLNERAIALKNCGHTMCTKCAKGVLKAAGNNELINRFAAVNQAVGSKFFIIVHTNS